ncbi:MAG: ATP synthase F1 subunit delta [Clostridiales Family XIII bacterium]|jgi:ATP synthase F1 delta subunit|nr:ATP synthase F1 subunit delta [Clostridiales Family XIII bacterium]
MENLNVNEVYGIALYEASADLGRTKEFQTSLEEIREAFDIYPQFGELLRSPALSAAQRRDVVHKVLHDKVPVELINFLYVLINKRRIGSFDGIVHSFNRLVDKRNGIAKGRIISASPLTEEQLIKLEAQTGDLMGVKVLLTPEVDAAIIGGVKIYVSGKLIDASIRKKLDDMKELLLS